MRSIRRNTLAAAALAAVALLGLSACSATPTPAAAPAPAPASSAAPAATEGPDATAVAADLVGPGCAAYAKSVPSGSGSIVGMAQDPVAVAASNNPILTTLVAAVSGKLNPKVNLVDTLDGSEFTVFAPVDSAFAKLPATTVKALGDPKNAALLTSILTYHVVPGQLLPADVVGQHQTVEGQAVTVAGSGNALTVNNAKVVCGGVHTANATVYLIDSVLTPPAK